MRFYLSSFIGDGSLDNPFRPPFDDFTIIDLRPPGSPAGLCLVAIDNPPGVTPSGAIDLGEDLDGILPVPVKRRLGNDLSVTLDPDDLRGSVVELVILHGKEDGSRWRPLKANHQGFHEVWLGERIYHAPTPQLTVITESFNRADAAGLGPDLTWVTVGGWSGARWATEANEARKTNTGGGLNTKGADSDLATDDHYAEWLITKLDAAGAANRSVAQTRIPGATHNDTGYQARIDRTTAPSYEVRLDRMDNGSRTEIAAPVAITPTLSYILRCEADGSTIRAIVEGTTERSVTDTNITGNLQTGVSGTVRTLDDVRQDLFEAGDLAAPPATVNLFVRKSRRHASRLV